MQLLLPIVATFKLFKTFNSIFNCKIGFWIIVFNDINALKTLLLISGALITISKVKQRYSHN
jgi:hypothetical protein